MRIFENYTRAEYEDYYDFKKNFRLQAPETFNFAYDVMDKLAEEKPDKVAMIWLGRSGEEKRFTFRDFSLLSNKAANFFAAQGIGKGDMVLLILKRRYEFWISMLALHKLGAIAIPATHLLTKKDIVYRNNYADVKAVICVNEGDIPLHVEQAAPESRTLQTKILVEGAREGWLSFDEGLAAASEEFPRPTGEAATTLHDPMILFFTSGTTGMPKMVLHNHSYPLAHIQTAIFWHNVQSDGIHFTVSDSGWGKCLWGKFYGQWFGETTVLVYEFDKSNLERSSLMK